MVKMRFLRGLVGLSLSLACLSSCDSVFDVHPYDVRVKGETQINAKQIVKIEELMKSKDTIRFAFISDTHQYLSDFSDEVADINKRDSIDFVIHGGDMTDFGGTREFEWAREKLFKLKVPFVTLLGNHDCLGTGEQAYLEMFGSPDFSFIAARIKFVCLNTNAMEFDYSKPVPNFDYMESHVTENASVFDRTVICMHAAPYCEQFLSRQLSATMPVRHHSSCQINTPPRYRLELRPNHRNPITLRHTNLAQCSNPPFDAISASISTDYSSP